LPDVKTMPFSQYHYLPLTPGYFAILVVAFVVVVILLMSLRYAYLSLGVSPSTALALLLGSLIGSYFNIPVFQLPPEQVMSDRVIDFFGMQYQVPLVEHWAGTVIAVNVGGAVIPTIMSLYLLFNRHLWIRGVIATAIVALVLHWLAHPVRGVGIAVPVFWPAMITALVALVLAREHAAPLAYIAGSMGTSARPRCASRFDRRRRNIRRHLSDRHPRRAAGEPLSPAASDHTAAVSQSRQFLFTARCGSMALTAASFCITSNPCGIAAERDDG
jgi:uncharacterized membrane protein